MNYYGKYIKYKEKYISKNISVNFLKWFDEKGGISKIMLRDTSNAGRETVAKQNISKNERILEVPYDIILSDETFDRLNLIPNIPDTISFTNKIVFLLLYYKKKQY